MWRILFVLLVACGNDHGTGPSGDIDAPAGDDAPPLDGPDTDAAAALALTSPAFTEGGAIPQDQSCNGANTSPQLAWVGAPPSAMSFAVVLTDKSNALVHWVIYDIPASATGLPADVDKVFAPPDVAGAHQTASYQANVRGYNGPCPPNTHTYEFAVHVLDVAALPGATMQTNRAQAITLIDQHRIGMPAKLTGTYTP
jgi:Raf kinase inhibitor-like YbhB/YbcL family protein